MCKLELGTAGDVAVVGEIGNTHVSGLAAGIIHNLPIRAVQIKAIGFHDLRHAHASELLSAGTPVKTVSKRLGHANATVTMNTYAHLLSGDDERAAKHIQRTLEKRLAKKGVKTKNDSRICTEPKTALTLDLREIS
ncbi:MAG TPA: tyrosine-type recombinase/integrase [Bryobacteraceae bacterium]